MGAAATLSSSDGTTGVWWSRCGWSHHTVFNLPRVDPFTRWDATLALALLVLRVLVSKSEKGVANTGLLSQLHLRRITWEKN